MLSFLSLFFHMQLNKQSTGAIFKRIPKVDVMGSKHTHTHTQGKVWSYRLSSVPRSCWRTVLYFVCPFTYQLKRTARPPARTASSSSLPSSSSRWYTSKKPNSIKESDYFLMNFKSMGARSLAFQTNAHGLCKQPRNLQYELPFRDPLRYLCWQWQHRCVDFLAPQC